MHVPTALFAFALASLAALGAAAAPPKPDTSRGDRMFADYFRAETARLAGRSLDAKTVQDWIANRDEYRRQLAEMLGLWPEPERTDLKPVVTGKTDHADFTVENLHFQSRPGLYVTGNLYVPKGLTKPAPAILYVCGHGSVKKDGVAYGAKAAYQHHGGWFARNGYVCLLIDTLQLGEIEGLHHGVFREGMWWWYDRGYTPAGVEAWNSIRALDYLQSRPEVDGTRLGVTGRSGGGAYSWWAAALDERIKAAVPVAGITDLQNHVVDGAIEGHCDCMFQVNTYGWDYAQVAALVAPRPLLLSNSDKDNIFPLEGVVRTHAKLREVYRRYNAADKLGLLITEGPHKDTQELQIPAMHWFNRHLKGEDPQVENTARPLSQPEQLRVFKGLPANQRNTEIHETFVPGAAHPSIPTSAQEWSRQRQAWMEVLTEKSFRGWPAQPGPLDLKEAFSVERQGVRFTAYDFTSQENIRLRLYLAQRAGLEKPDLVVVNLLDEDGWRSWLAGMRSAFPEELKDESPVEPDAKAFEQTSQMFRSFKWGMAYLAPRGIGPTATNPDPKKQTHLRRRFMLLGQTLDGMQVWDTRRGLQALRAAKGMTGVPLWLQAERKMAGVALYAALFEPDLARLDLHSLPKSHREGPSFLNVLKVMDIPQAVAMAAERVPVKLYAAPEAWEYPRGVARALGWDAKRFEIRAAR